MSNSINLVYFIEMIVLVNSPYLKYIYFLI